MDLTTGYDSNNPPSFIPSLPLCSGQMIQFQAQCLKDNISLYLTLRYVIYLNTKLIFNHTITVLVVQSPRSVQFVDVEFIAQIQNR